MTIKSIIILLKFAHLIRALYDYTLLKFAHHIKVFYTLILLIFKRFFWSFLFLSITKDGEYKFKKLKFIIRRSRDITEFLARKRIISNYERMTNEELLSTLKKTPQKQEKSKNNQQQIISKNKERIEIIREGLKDLGYKLLRDELKEIKRHLYMVENKKGSLG